MKFPKYTPLKYNVRFIKLKEKITSIITSFLYSLTFPFWLIKYILTTIKNIIFFIPKIILSIPKWPFYIKSTIKLCIYKFVVFIGNLIYKQAFLRKKMIFTWIKNHLIIVLFAYIFLSIIDEIPDYTKHIHAYKNVWWPIIYGEGLNLLLSAFICYNICWLLSLYFIDLRYCWKNFIPVFGPCTFGLLDIIWPDFLLQTLDVIMYETLWFFYIWVGIGNWLWNEALEEEPEDVYLVEHTRKITSWQTDDFYLKSKTFTKKKKFYWEQYELWKKVDEDVEIDYIW